MAHPPITHGVQVHAFVDRSVRKDLEAIAASNHRSIAGELRCAIDQHVQRNEPAKERE